jgi:hypothetical protein
LPDGIFIDYQFWEILGIFHGHSVYRAPGTDVMILKIFSPKNLAKKLAFFTQNKAKF